MLQASRSLRAGISALMLVACVKEATSPMPGRPASMQILSGDLQSGPVGTELPSPLVVKVLDSAGQAVATQLVNFRVTSGGGTVFAGASLTNSSGIAQERWTLGTNPTDSQRVEARAVDNVTGAALVFAVFKATALAGPPVQLRVDQGDGQSATVGTAVATRPSVIVPDQFQNPVPGVRVTFAVASGSGSVSSPSQVTDATGVATVGSWTMGTTPGSNTLTATVTGLPAVIFTATGTPVPVAFVSVAPAAASLAGGGTVQLTATTEDAAGNVLTGRVVTWTSTEPAVANVSSTGLVTGLNAGVASVTATSEGKAGAAAITVSVVFTALSAGLAHTCGITTSGAAYCWGLNDVGQLGDGMTTRSFTPVAVAGGLSLTALSAGDIHTCGITTSGGTYCWGGSFAGSTPVAVAGGLTFTALTADEQTCGVVTSGVLYCWGFNRYGALGSGDTMPHSDPVPVVGGLTFATASAGVAHTCGVTTGGVAYCWGYNAFGQLGIGSADTLPHSAPVAVVGGLTFTQVSAGRFHTCALTGAGAAYCWGDNELGELGDGSTTNSWTPVAVSGGLTFTMVSASSHYSCGLTTTGAAYCWGYNASGELGTGSMTSTLTPVPVAGSLSFTSLGTARGNGFFHITATNHTCALTTMTVAYCWGSGYGNVPAKVAGQP